LEDNAFAVYMELGPVKIRDVRNMILANWSKIIAITTQFAILPTKKIFGVYVQEDMQETVFNVA
jgi:hypothetical protein